MTGHITFNILAARKEFIGEVAIEDNPPSGEYPEERNASGKLVDEVDIIKR
jgi:hypothetical protein